MGCTSSTEAVTDPQTGQTKQKHKMGGAHPGNRRHAQQQYAPPASQFNSQGQATAHFISYGGGNALVLQQGGVAQPVVGQKQPQYIQVTLPDGVVSGQTIHVQAPDGRLNEIIIPEGFGPGSTFTVEFADDPAPTSKTTTNYNAPTTQYTETAPATSLNNNRQGNDYDDGFATGFNNPNFIPAPIPPPTTTTTATTSAGGRQPNLTPYVTSATTTNSNAYPTATDAKPVYSTTPTYPAATY